MPLYLIASNFIAYQGVNIGEGYTEFERYDTVKKAIEDNGKTLDENQAITLRKEVGIKTEKEDKLQWSVIYNLITGQGKIFANRHTYNLIEFQLDMDK